MQSNFLIHLTYPYPATYLNLTRCSIMLLIQCTNCFASQNKDRAPPAFLFFPPQYKDKLATRNSTALAETTQLQKKELFSESLQQAFAEQMFSDLFTQAVQLHKGHPTVSIVQFVPCSQNKSENYGLRICKNNLT